MQHVVAREPVEATAIPVLPEEPRLLRGREAVADAADHHQATLFDPRWIGERTGDGEQETRVADAAAHEPEARAHQRAQRLPLHHQVRQRNHGHVRDRERESFLHGREEGRDETTDAHTHRAHAGDAVGEQQVVHQDPDVENRLTERFVDPRDAAREEAVAAEGRKARPATAVEGQRVEQHVEPEAVEPRDREEHFVQVVHVGVEAVNGEHGRSRSALVAPPACSSDPVRVVAQVAFADPRVHRYVRAREAQVEARTVHRPEERHARRLHPDRNGSRWLAEERVGIARLDHGPDQLAVLEGPAEGDGMKAEGEREGAHRGPRQGSNGAVPRGPGAHLKRLHQLQLEDLRLGGEVLGELVPPAAARPVDRRLHACLVGDPRDDGAPWRHRSPPAPHAGTCT